MSGLQLRYFILKPKGRSMYAQASREALKAYAEAIELENKELSEDLNAWVERETVDQDFGANKQEKP